MSVFRGARITDDFGKWFQQFWNISGASTKQHPAPFPLELAYRLVRMFSFWGDTVIDPFCGTGTTMLAAMKCGRNSIGVEIDRDYCRMAATRLKSHPADVFLPAELQFQKLIHSQSEAVEVREERAAYQSSHRKHSARRKLA